MQESDLVQLVQLIETLYSPSTPPQIQTSIQSQLQSIQSSAQAWSLIPPILGSPSYPSQVRFFAASTLQLKLARQWDSLPSSQHEPVKLEVLAWLSASAARAYPRAQLPTSNSGSSLDSAGERVVLRKLASAVTSLSLRLMDEWNDWLLEVITRIVAGGASTEGVLQVLSVVIEQVARAELVGPKRSSYMGSLSSSTSLIVSTLSTCLSPPSSDSEINSALQCFHSFLLASQFHHSDLDILYPLILPHLHDPSTRPHAINAIEELIERSSGASSSVGITRYISRIKTEQLVTTWACSPLIATTLQFALQSEDPSDVVEDVDFLSIVRLLTTLSEHLLSFLFQPPPNASQIPHLSLQSSETQTLFHHILTITTWPGYGIEVYKVNELSEGFWMALQEEAADVGLIAGGGDGREGRRGREADWFVVKGVFEALSEGMRSRARRPGWEVLRGWAKDMKEDFRTYRSTTLSEISLYAFYVLRDQMLARLVSLALEQVTFAPDSEDAYEDLESSLFLLYAIQEATSSDENLHLPHLFNPSFLSLLPTSFHPSLRTTALRLIGAYAPWFASESFSREPECLAAVTFVVSALEEKNLTSTAARSLRLLCDSNRKSLQGHVGSFVQVLGGLEGKIEDIELSKVLESVSSVIQALPEDQLIEPLLGLANPIIHKLLSSLTTSPIPDSREITIQQLGYLTSCAKGLSDPEGDLVDLDASFDDSQQVKDASTRLLADPRIAQMRGELGRAIEHAARTWSNDAEVVQALYEYVRHSTLDAIPSPLALDTFQLLELATSALAASISSVWLSISTSLLARLARSRSDHQLTDQELKRLVKPLEVALSTVLSSLSTPQALSENPDVVASFLSFNSSIIRSFPRAYTLLPTHLSAMIQFAILGLGQQERFSLKATIELLIAVVQQTRMASSSSETFAQVLEPHLPRLVESLVEAIAGKVPRSHLVSLSELLHAMLLRAGEGARTILAELMKRDGWPNKRVDKTTKDKFEKALRAARTGKQARTAVNDFAMVCRGLDGTVYGVESGNAFD